MVTHPHADVLDQDVTTGRHGGLRACARRALQALAKAGVPHAVVGAVALAARGLPRNTHDIRLVVMIEDAHDALAALTGAGFSSVAPIALNRDPMYVLRDARSGGDLDLLVATAEPESTVVEEARPADVFGLQAPTATLEHLVLMLLYSAQPRHLGDLARIITETDVDLVQVTSYLEEVHPEMLPLLAERVELARHPPPAPPRPPRRRARLRPSSSDRRR